MATEKIKEKDPIKNYVLVEFDRESWEITHVCTAEEAAVAALLATHLAQDLLSDETTIIEGPHRRDKGAGL